MMDVRAAMHAKALDEMWAGTCHLDVPEMLRVMLPWESAQVPWSGTGCVELSDVRQQCPKDGLSKGALIDHAAAKISTCLMFRRILHPHDEMWW
jgi:hypothetical protein